MKAACLFLPLFALVFSWGCDPQNTAKVGCREPDCKASCLTKGFEDGACGVSGCTCTPWDTESYEWPDRSTGPVSSDETDSGSGSGSDDTSSHTETAEQTDSSSDSGSDSEKASDTDTDSGSDSGSDSASDSAFPDSDTASSSSADTASV